MEDSWKQEELRWKKEQGISMPEDDEEERVLDSTFSDDYEDLENRSENYHSSGSHQSHSSFLSALGGLSRRPSQIEKRRRSSNTTNNTSSSPRQAFTELKRRLSKGSNQNWILWLVLDLDLGLIHSRILLLVQQMRLRMKSLQLPLEVQLLDYFHSQKEQKQSKGKIVELL